MKKLSYLGAGLLLANATGWAWEPTVWHQWPSSGGGNDHWYGLSTVPDRWTTLHSDAVPLGFDLASVTSPAENGFIVGLLSPGVGNYWIGLNDVLAEGNYVWSDGGLFGYSNWALGEPNNLGNEDATHYFWDGQQFLWNDLSTGAQLIAIFEATNNPLEVPESSHAAVVGGAAILALGVWRARSARA